MKASSMFALTIAILLGLSVVAGARYLGAFERPQPKAEVRAPAPPMILAANQNLFQGITLTTSHVYVRPLRASEIDDYQRNPEKYLPPLASAAHLRVLTKSIEADKPMLKEYFQDTALPDKLSTRLEPGMRTVNLSLMKEKCAGGMIQTTEYVDVFLTCKIFSGDHANQSITQTACIARDLKVITKRNTLWSLAAVDKDDRPIDFTLQANPYRAALIEFVKGRGAISMNPSPARNPKAVGAANTLADSPEFRDDEQRTSQFINGEITVSEADLERIFKLKPLPARREPKELAVITRIHGVTIQGKTIFNADGSSGVDVPPNPSAVPQMEGHSPLGYRFSSPEAQLPKAAKKGG
jgi:Flp pilus assembly protein CpaB